MMGMELYTGRKAWTHDMEVLHWLVVARAGTGEAMIYPLVNLFVLFCQDAFGPFVSKLKAS